MKIDITRALGGLADLTKGEGEAAVNPVLQELDKPEVKTAVLALILNEIRAYKTSGVTLSSGEVSRTKTYDVHAGFAKLSAYVDLLDIPALIESRQTPPTPPDDDRLPDVP